MHVYSFQARGSVQMNMQFPFEGMDLEQSCLRTTGIAPDTLHSADMGSFRYACSSTQLEYICTLWVTSLQLHPRGKCFGINASVAITW